MPAPLAVDREAVRVLAIAVGIREAARQMGISVSAVMQWSKRGGWLADTKPRQQLPASMQPVPVSDVSKSPSAALTDMLAADKSATITASAKFARRAMQAAAEAKQPLKVARQAKDAFAVAAQLHGIGTAQDQASSVNVLSIGSTVQIVAGKPDRS